MPFVGLAVDRVAEDTTMRGGLGGTKGEGGECSSGEHVEILRTVCAGNQGHGAMCLSSWVYMHEEVLEKPLRSVTSPWLCKGAMLFRRGCPWEIYGIYFGLNEGGSAAYGNNGTSRVGWVPKVDEAG